MRALFAACLALAACKFDGAGVAYLADDGGPTSDAPPQAAGKHRFSASLGGSGKDEIHGVARFPDGDLALTGVVSGAIDFGAGPVNGHGNLDIFVMRVSPGGQLRWAKDLGLNDAEKGERVAVDANGDVIVAGSFNRAIDLGGGPVTWAGSWDIFVAKYAGADGAYVWSTTLGGSSVDIATSLALSPGHVVVGGGFSGTVVDDSGVFNASSLGQQDGLIVQLDSSTGAVEWLVPRGGSGVDTVTAVATSADGHIAVGGTYDGPIDLGTGGGTVLTMGQTDVFFTYLDDTGAVRWARHFGGGGRELAGDALVTSLGSVVFVGSYTGQVAFGGQLLAAADAEEAYAAAFDPTGQPLWSLGLPGQGIERATAVAEYAPGLLVIGGTYEQTFTVVGTALGSVGQSDDFLASLTAGGILRWAVGFGGAGDEQLLDLAGAGGEVDVVGWSSAAIDAGGGLLPYAGDHDGFWARWSE